LPALVAALLVAPPSGAAAGGPPVSQLVPAVVAAYGGPGTLAVAIAAQLRPGQAWTTPAAEARAGRLPVIAADNGPAAARPFPTASLVKLFIAADVLHRAREGHVVVPPEDWARLQDMIRRSSDPAASSLWVRYGGGRMVADVAGRYGLTGTAPPGDSSQWGETTTTARDLARFLALLPVVAHPYDAATLQIWMRTATPLGADGFDQRFGLLGSAPGHPAVKQGWMCCLGGNWHLHSVGVLGTRVVVLLSEVPRGVGVDAGRRALTGAAGALPPPAA
jgi:hypothetical protein